MRKLWKRDGLGIVLEGQLVPTKYQAEINDDESSILRDRLLPLIVCLLRTARLPAVLRIYRDTLITEMKAAIKSIVAELLPVLLARSLESDLATGEKAVDSDGGGLSLVSKLRNLSSEGLVQLLIAIFKVLLARKPSLLLLFFVLPTVSIILHPIQETPFHNRRFDAPYIPGDISTVPGAFI